MRVRRTEKDENVLKYPFSELQDVCYGYTKSMVQVSEIMKNTSGQQIGLEDEIRILENQFTYIDGDTEVTCHVDQYKMMEPGKEYILYLCYSEQDEWYYLLSGLQGKVPVSEEEEILFPASQITYYVNQPKMEEGSEMQRVMEEIRKDSLVKYN